MGGFTFGFPAKRQQQQGCHTMRGPVAHWKSENVDATEPEQLLRVKNRQYMSYPTTQPITKHKPQAQEQTHTHTRVDYHMRMQQIRRPRSPREGALPLGFQRKGPASAGPLQERSHPQT